MNIVSNFEVLPDELILIVFRYLDYTNIACCFYNLNMRLNSLAASSCHSLSLVDLTHTQFDFMSMNVLPRLGSNIRSLVIDGNWYHFIANRYPTRNLNLASMLPNLYSLILEYFTDEDLLKILDSIRNLKYLVKLHIKCLAGRYSPEILTTALTTNDNRLQSVTIDQDSIFLNVRNENSSYTNIQELTFNLIDGDMLGDLLTLVPNIRRLQIYCGQSPCISTSAVITVPPLAHIQNFELHSPNTLWELSNIADVLSKMPALNRLVLDLCTDDEHLVNGENLAMILPSSITEIHLFILYCFIDSYIEVDKILATWPKHISTSCWLNESLHYAIIHTIPFNVCSAIVPATIGRYILTDWEYFKSVAYLKIYRASSPIDINMILQHFRQVQKLNIHMDNGSEEDAETQVTTTPNFYLPRLKYLRIEGRCEIFDLFNATPYLSDISIDQNCFNNIMHNKSLCHLLQRQILRLEIFQVRNIHEVDLHVVLNEFTHLRRLILLTNDSNSCIDSLILQLLNMWTKKIGVYVFIKGRLSAHARSIIDQWSIDHSHLNVGESFVINIDNKTDSFHAWL